MAERPLMFHKQSGKPGLVMSNLMKTKMVLATELRPGVSSLSN